MARSVILDKKSGITKSIKNSNYSIADILEENNNSIIIEENNIVQDIKDLGYSQVKLSEYLNRSVIRSKLPFRVRFSNIQIPGYSSTNVPPIGIAIIGFNNYIL